MSATLSSPATTTKLAAIVRDCDECFGEGTVEVAYCHHSGNCPCGGRPVTCEACYGEGVVPVECTTCGDDAVVATVNGHACVDCGAAAGLIEKPQPKAHVIPVARLAASAAALGRTNRPALSQREQWLQQGYSLPYGYNKPVELGGFCVECDASHGGHYRDCGAVN